MGSLQPAASSSSMNDPLIISQASYPAADRKRKQPKEEEPSDESADEERPPKKGGAGGKGKSSKAKSCLECRRLKLKCNRVWPCSMCIKRGTAEICPDGALMTARGRTMILASNEELHSRIADLERALYDATAGAGSPHPLLKSAFHFHPDSSPSSPAAKPPARLSLPPPGITDPSLPPHHSQIERGSWSEQDRQDGGAGYLEIDEAEGSSRFFGANAGAAFLMQESATHEAQPSVTDILGIPLNTLASPGDSNVEAKGWVESFPFERSSAFHQRQTAEVLRMNLPDRSQAEELCRLFFKNLAWGYSVVVKETFDLDFLSHVYPADEFSSPPINTQRLAVVFFVLSLGSLFDLNLVPYNQLSKEYMALGRACLALDASASITFVQAVHLQATHVMNNGRVTSGGHASWPLLGQAMRAAQAIGLHRDGAAWGLPQEQVNERRRVFWETLSYDIFQSVSQGRPRMVQYMALDTKFPEREPGDPAYHEERYKLLRLLARINDEQIRTSPSSYETVMEIDRDLRQFEKDLPAELICKDKLSVYVSSEEEGLLLQQHTILFNINVALLFLHRGWFARALRDSPNEPLSSKYRPSYVAEMEACKTITSIVRRLARVRFELIARRWFYFFHSFSACVCFAASVIRSPGSSLARSVFTELDLGVKLFESAQRKNELPILLRLRQRAESAIRAHRASKQYGLPLLPSATQNEGIDLLGSGTTLHVTAAVAASSTSQGGGDQQQSSSSSSHASQPTPSATTMGLSPDVNNGGGGNCLQGHSPADSIPPFEPPELTGSFASWMADPFFTTELAYNPNPTGAFGSLGDLALGGHRPLPSNDGGHRQTTDGAFPTNVGSPDFDFDAFLAGLGIAPASNDLFIAPMPIPCSSDP